MDRPAKAEVDKMLAEYQERDCECSKHHTPRLDAHELASEVRALRESERVAWDNVNYPTPSSFVHCYPHKTAWVRGSPGEGCSACKLERENKTLRQQLSEALDPLLTAQMIAERWGTEPEAQKLMERIVQTGVRLAGAEADNARLRAELEAAKAVINRQHDATTALVKAARQTVQGVPPGEAMVLLVDALKPFEEG